MNYFVDYFGFYLGGIGYRMQLKNRNERLIFDILSINPANDILIFSLPETLLEDSNRILIKYVDFWKNNIFKIALDKKYKNAQVYINDRLKLLDNNSINNNYELDIYQSPLSNYFINDYLINDLKLRGKKSFIIHRTNNADINHRTLLKESINKGDLFYKNLSSYLKVEDIDKMLDFLYNQADNKKNLFQRGHILNQVFKMYPSLNSNHAFLYNVFDNNYNDALAISVNAQRMSKMYHTLSGITLAKFLYNFDYTMYKKICSFTPTQLFVLCKDISWLMFIQRIKELYEYLFINKNINSNYNIYKEYKKKSIVKTYMFGFIINIIDHIINQLNIPQPYLYNYYIHFKTSLNNYIEAYLNSKNYLYYIASDIYDRKESIQKLINDIMS